MGKSIRELTAEIREVNTALGWRTGGNTFGDHIALLHTEVGEATEAYRDYRLADATESDTNTYTNIEGIIVTVPRVGPAKPEGVGSELADMVVRLLDTCDIHGFPVWELDLELADVTPFSESFIAATYNIDTFGDWMAWLHRHVVRFQDSEHGAHLLRAIVTVAERYNFDLTAEVERKIAYNRTRPYQHGGRTLSEATP